VTETPSRRRTAKERWAALQQVIVPSKQSRGRYPILDSQKEERDDISETSSANERHITQQFQEQNFRADLDEEDNELTKYWDEYKVPEFDSTAALSETDIQLQLDEFKSPEVPHVLETFQQDSEPLSLEVTKISEYVVEQQRELMQRALLDARMKTATAAKEREMDALWREHAARLRVEKLELQTKRKIENERAKVFELAIQKDRETSINFKRAREDLEEHLKQQNATAKEVFGELVSTKEVITYFLILSKSILPLSVAWKEDRDFKR